MPKTDGYLTRERILQVAETLFSEQGYDAASIGAISKLAGINKATIYYHFSDKRSILHALYEDMIMQMRERIVKNNSSDSNIMDHIKKEVDFLRQKKDIVSILLMEAMKTNNDDDSLFLIASSEINREKNRIINLVNSPEKKNLFLAHEFFTGFIPIFSFVVLEDKYRKYFGISEEQVIDAFFAAIKRAHFDTHVI